MSGDDTDLTPQEPDPGELADVVYLLDRINRTRADHPSNQPQEGGGDGQGWVPLGRKIAGGGVEHVTTERTYTVGAYRPPSCADCGVKLEPVSDAIVGPDGTWDSLQAEGALVVRLEGGDGMSVDGWDIEHVWVLCGDCAHRFVDAHPWMRR